MTEVECCGGSRVKMKPGEQKIKKAVSAMVNCSVEKVTHTWRRAYMKTRFDVLLTVHLNITLVNDQRDAQFFYFIIRLLLSSTCFEQVFCPSSGV